MKVLIIIAVVVATATHVHASPFKHKIQIYEIHENPTWKDTNQRFRRPKILPSTLIPGMTLDNIDKPKISVYEILNKYNQIVLKEIGNIGKHNNEESDINDIDEVRKMIRYKYEGDTSVSEESDSGEGSNIIKYESDTNSSGDSEKDFVDATRSKTKLRTENKKEHVIVIV